MIFLDLETTGIDPRSHGILSIGALDFNNPPSYFMLAEAHYRNRKYLDSIRVMTDLSKKYEKNPKIYTQMGLAYQKSNRPEDAIINFRKAIELNVKYEDAYRALVDLYSQQKMYTVS